MRLTKTFTLAACALLVAASACAENRNSPNGNANASAQASPSPEGTPVGQGRVQIFKGTLVEGEQNLSVQMKLRREGDKLEGSYFYENVRNELKLRGTINPQGSFSLQEFDQEGAQTGVFIGKWGTSPAGTAEMSGAWTKHDGSRIMQFTLTELPVEFSANLALVSRQIREENPERRYSIYAEYPQIEGATDARVGDFNQRARALVAAKVEEFKKNVAQEVTGPPEHTAMGSDISIGYDLGVGTDDLISVQFQISDYYSGAAHPNHHTEVLNYDLKAGHVLKLGDLFKPAALYLRTISDYSINDLKQQFRKQGTEDPAMFDAGVEEGAAPNADNYKSWLITRRGLQITFDPYQVAPYAAGPQQVVIPYATLGEIINPEGPLAPILSVVRRP